MTDNPCAGCIFIGDDRWGGFVNFCELEAGHEDREPHRASRDGCVPPGWLCWTGTYDAPPAEPTYRP